MNDARVLCRAFSQSQIVRSAARRSLGRARRNLIGSKREHQKRQALDGTTSVSRSIALSSSLAHLFLLSPPPLPICVLLLFPCRFFFPRVKMADAAHVDVTRASLERVRAAMPGETASWTGVRSSSWECQRLLQPGGYCCALGFLCIQPAGLNPLGLICCAAGIVSVIAYVPFCGARLRERVSFVVAVSHEHIVSSEEVLGLNCAASPGKPETHVTKVRDVIDAQNIGCGAVGIFLVDPATGMRRKSPKKCGSSSDLPPEVTYSCLEKPDDLVRAIAVARNRQRLPLFGQRMTVAAPAVIPVNLDPAVGAVGAAKA